MLFVFFFFFFSSRRRHTTCLSDWSSDVCSSDLFFIGCARGDHDDAQLRILPEKISHGFHRIRRQRSLENQHICSKLRGCGLRLRQRLRLPNHANVIFQCEDLAQTGAEDGLGIGQNHSDELAFAAVFACSEIFVHANRNGSHSVPYAYARSKWYSSITTPTPRRPRSSKLRTTRPWQSICTSRFAPTTSAGNRIVKSTTEPTGTSLSMANSTPLAEMFSVSAVYALPWLFTDAERCSGNRGALCISS